MLYPIIDIGSNTTKLAVLDSEQLFSQPPVFFKAVPQNLRAHVENNCLTKEATEKLCQLLRTFCQTARRLTSTPPLAFATASLRGLDNTQEVLERIQETCGLAVKVISGEQEAYYSFLGAKGGLSVKEGMVVDLGGGSTELLTFQGEKVERSVSLPFGCLTLYHSFFDQGTHDFDGCCRHVFQILSSMAPPFSGNTLLLTGGSAKAILKYKNLLESKKGFTLGIRQLRKIQHHYEQGEKKERDKIADVLKDRYRLVPPALAVFSQITRFYKKEQMLVCRSGVREGYLLDYLQKKL